MITVKRLNGATITINALLIESIESTPDTVVSLVTGNRFVVRETVDEIVEKVAAFQRRIRAEGRSVNPVEGIYRRE